MKSPTPKQREVCKYCGRTTDSMYSFNDGIYCDDHKLLAAHIQNLKISYDMLRDKWQRIWKQKAVIYNLEKNP